MVSTVMDVQECIVPDSPLPTSDKMSLDLGATSVEDIQLKEQSTIGDDFAPKVRKPYTITKQRERWTEEEHKKFLEALKLYGRAWRRIEDHVGSKTAVQIRSHAQKFFSKVVRESNTTGDGVVVKPIEIPPPRPKRKPMHPYPRKMPSPVKAAILIPKKTNVMGLENQSPTSVLSAVGSDLSAGADSCVIPNGSLSSFSSDLALNSGNVFGSEAPKLLSEDAVSYGEDENSCTDEDIPLDLDLPSPKTPFVKRDLSESAVQCLKLFGKTLLVDLNEQSCSTQETCNPKREDTSLFPLRVVPVKLPTSTSEDLLSSLVYSTPEIKSDVDFSPAPFLWLSLASDSYPEVLSPTPIKAGSLYTKNEKLENDEKEGSSTGSNTDLVGDKTWDIDSCPKRKGKGEKSFSSYKLSKRVSVTSSNCRRGFVPYKRCFAEQVSSPTEIVEEREKQRIRLCL